MATVLCMDTLNGDRREVAPVPGRVLNQAVREAIREPKLLLRPSHGRAFGEQSLPFGDKTRPSASLMFVPIQNHEKVIGLLSLQSYTPNAYTEHDLQTLKALADHCAGALERIRAESENESLTAELRKRVEELRLLNEELENRVQQRTAQLQAINKELEAFSYSVSHDLRAPLRSIRGFTEVLLERHQAQLDARGQEFLRRVCQSAQQMDTLIEDLLKLSRVGRAEMQTQEVDISSIAQSIIAQLQQNEPERKVEISVMPGLKGCGDERLIRVAMENLLQNAWKFTSKTARAKIEVGFQTRPRPAFYVRDNGAGFEMTYAHRLFGVFQRLHTTSEFPGTGVGLATTHRIITRHGGTIWPESQPERGATFYFTLPPNEPC
jgi:signal transduction histidine kinase